MEFFIRNRVTLSRDNCESYKSVYTFQMVHINFCVKARVSEATFSYVSINMSVLSLKFNNVLVVH